MGKRNKWHPRIRIIQALCPKRHCLVAMSYSLEEYTTSEAIRLFKALMQQQSILEHCGICGSTEITYERGITRFRDKETADRELKQLEAKQLLTRLLIDVQKKESVNN